MFPLAGVCPRLSCDLPCANGYAKGENDCRLCMCRERGAYRYTNYCTNGTLKYNTSDSLHFQPYPCMVHHPFLFCADDDDDDTVEELRERLRCHPDCIRESTDRYFCDIPCNG